ncbi:MAG: hypothetical protein NUV98_03585 [Candidatus Roizmanbacteria bacterium]|nr:hypothetical protein [Candidatus Roizmanbacteria bacterium]
MRSKTKYIIIINYLLASMYSMPAHAQIDVGAFDFFKRFSTIGALVSTLLPNLLIFAGVILMVYIVIAGFNMIRSSGSGDAEAAGKAKQTLTYGIIGFVIIFTAALVIQLIEYLTGINIFNPEQTQFK